MNEKIYERHLGRKAILYVRQSSAHQVQENEESRALQYAMESRLRAFGWVDVEVIDDDLGRSAAGAVERAGFQRMVAEISMGSIGAVAAREVSRFARNSREWQQLIEICRVVDTLVIDQESIYDPRIGNDRLLLGLKGTINEYELDLLRIRAHEALQAKARRGELLRTPAIGYLKTEDDKLEKSPDLRVQQGILLIFKKMLELGSVYQTLHWFRENEILIPATSSRCKNAPVEWKPAGYLQLKNILQNPIYAGTYAYGRNLKTSRFDNGQLRRSVVRKSIAECSVLIKDHHEGYVSWAQFERVQEMIAKNTSRSNATGAAKNGAALLAGLIRCKRCGRRTIINYTGPEKNYPRYSCYRGNREHGDALCISFSGVDVERRIADLILEVIRPAATDAAVLAEKQLAHAHGDVLAALQTELEAARYESDRAWKKFDAADPENRLVADELERRLNVALVRVQEIEERIQVEEAQLHRTKVPTVEVLRSLAGDLEKVWNDPRTDWRLKKRIARTLIEEVIADVDDRERCVVLLVHWKGGVHTELRVPKRRIGSPRPKTQDGIDLVEAIRALSLVCADQEIAAFLGRNGMKTAKGNRWTREIVTAFRSHHKIPRYSLERRAEEQLLTIQEVIDEFHIAAETIHAAVAEGRLAGLHPLPFGPWIFRRPDVDHWRRSLKARGRRKPMGIPPNCEQMKLKISDT